MLKAWSFCIHTKSKIKLELMLDNDTLFIWDNKKKNDLFFIHDWNINFISTKNE